MDTLYATVGREKFPGLKVNICCVRDTEDLEASCPLPRFRAIYVKEGQAIFRNGEQSQIVTSPSVLCVNEKDDVGFLKASGVKMDVMYFDPICFSRYEDFDSIEEWRKQLFGDEYFFRPFFRRGDQYIGACPISYSLGNRISQLIEMTDVMLEEQNDDWPCRSRSYFIELVLNLNSIYNGDIYNPQIYGAKMTDELAEVIDWIHLHYLDKVVLEDITKEFHTNKTTLNQKFKAVMGVTVMEYIINLRMEIACSLLRKTYLPVAEIMERAGYRDDAHFLRSFKKCVGCTPTEYRSQFGSSEE